VTGHYEFEIKLIIDNREQKTILRRFSDMEWLHLELIKFNPGCRIPDLPEKSAKFNSPFINENDLNSRKKSIQDHLNYIANHKYLSKNPAFEKFFSQDFERNNSGKGLTSLISGVDKLRTSMMDKLGFGKSVTVSKGTSHVDNNQKLEKDREYLSKLYHAIADKDCGLLRNMVNL
jgi:hypothetical protein